MAGLGEVVLEALHKHKHQHQHDHELSDGPGPEKNISSSDSHSTTFVPGWATPPRRTLEPEQLNNSDSISVNPSPRPFHRSRASQASFDWFAPPSSSGLKQSSLPTTDGFAEDEEKPKDEDQRFKGAFTDEDMGRGASIMRQIQEEASGAKTPRGRQTRASSIADKGKSRAPNGADASDGEWEDVVGTGRESSSAQKSVSMGGRRSTLWNLHSGRKGSSKPGSGSSTPDDGGDGGARPRLSKRGTTAVGWNALRNRLKSSGAGGAKGLSKTLSGHELITELTTGILPLVMIKMGAFDRDEHGDPRIPILMNYLKLRITDSLHPLHDRHAVFRIELEYGDSLVKWVIYRELRDFVNLHAHYRVSNLRHGIDKFPPFPKTSLPYLNWLKSEGRTNVGKAEFARAQRDILENYLLKLIRATMFGPGANRLCKFLEISAMSIALATSESEQGKQGYLRIMSAGASHRKMQGFHPFSWKARHDPKWFLVRDSYIVAVNDPASLEVYEVFMIDSTFEIVRPTRVYRQGLQFFKGDGGDSDEEGGKPERGHNGAGDPLDPSATDPENHDLRDSSNHTFYLKSSERRLRLVAKTERQQDQFIASIEKMVARTIWAGKNRFDSFAPIRLNVAAQWLIDGRDYFWSLSRAIMLAKKTIYIHDWWLSPELYLRRPPVGNKKWRLDNLLQRKAREGVKIYVIIYKEVSNDFTPVDSTYSKTRLRGLHPNVHVQRSPSHTSTGTLLWSHHEKMCVIDETIGFMGGLDLCFGRWDSPGHVLVDEDDEDGAGSTSQAQEGSSHIWPGKDYANSRVLDFHTLSKPDEDMYDRSKVPRQPWHDIGLQIIGQPARDLCRHFIQRWNHLLRIKHHTVPMPFLLPAPEFTAHQLQEQRITGTCEVQICRSVGPWSMGISHVEHSIQNAYIKAIQLSDHFVYIENQFFISSTEVEGTTIENKIGDALVSRIVRAHIEGTKWRAVIIIPLVPGYPYPIDHSDAGSVRLIMECQNRTICRGEHSIFARLRREGIDPDEYITFFGLRGWGKLSTGALTTEAVYIHAKAMVVDDRIVIIGSANINERSQRGDRDSELACVIRDTDMIASSMGGQPYQVGRFAHTMRVRLMREHLGVDVDELEVEEGDNDLLERAAKKMQGPEDAWDPDSEQKHGTDSSTKGSSAFDRAQGHFQSAKENVGSVLYGAGQTLGLALDKGQHALTHEAESVTEEAEGAPTDEVQHTKESDASKIVDGTKSMSGFASTVVPTLEEKTMAEGRPHGAQRNTENNENASNPNISKKTTQSSKVDDTRKLPMDTEPVTGDSHQSLTPISEDGPDKQSRVKDDSPPPDIAGTSHPRVNGTSFPNGNVNPTGPLSGATTSGIAKDKSGAANRNAVAGNLRRNLREKPGSYTLPVPPAIIDPANFADPLVDSFYKEVWMATAVRNTQGYRKVFRCVPDDLVQTWRQYREFQTWAERHNKAPKDVVPPGDEPPHSDPANHSGQHGSGGGGSGGGSMGQGVKDEPPPVETIYKANSRTRARSGSVTASGDRRTPSSASASAAGDGHDHDEGFPQYEREQMEALLEDMHGHLVIYPTRFLEAESAGGNFLFSKDRLPPLSIYD